MSPEVQLVGAAAVGVGDLRNTSCYPGETANGTGSTGPSQSSVLAPADPSRPGGNPLEEPLLDLEQGGENEALREIDNVLWIKNLEINSQNRCQEALKSWAEKDSLFTSRIDRKRKQSSDFQNEVYQLVGFYSVFQGVLLTAAAQSNLLHCNNTWTVSLLSSLASFVTVIGVILKLRNIKALEDTFAGDEATRRELGTLAALPSPTAEPSAANKMTLEFDESATYKVYRAVTSGSGIRISISPEEISRYATVYIVPDAQNRQSYCIEGDSRPFWRLPIFSVQKLFRK